jgi:2-dehydropantoate 2-reductase
MEPRFKLMEPSEGSALYTAAVVGGKLDVIVLGAGAVGLGLTSALVAGGGARVRVVARPGVAESLREHGLLRSGIFGEVAARPGEFEVATSVAALAGPPADVVLVAIKSFDSDAAAAELAGAHAAVGAATRLVLCQNGWGNAERFARHFAKDRVWNARVITGFRKLAPHRVDVTVHAEPVRIGHLFGEDAVQIAPLCAAIARGGIPCEPSQDIARDLWAKLLYNAVLNPLGAILGASYGALGASPHTRGVMEALARESFAAMRAAGQETHWPSADAWLSDLYGRLLPPTAAHESSMLQDLRAGRRTEIDAITGAVVALAARHGVEAPVSRSVLALVRFLEARGTP